MESSDEPRGSFSARSGISGLEYQKNENFPMVEKAKRRALICGVSGQDGAYLSQLLLSKGYEVWGTSRDAQMSSFASLHQLKIADQVKTLSMSLTDFRSVLQVISKVQPDEIITWLDNLPWDYRLISQWIHLRVLRLEQLIY